MIQQSPRTIQTTQRFMDDSLQHLEQQKRCTNESSDQSDSSAVLLATANAVLHSDYSQLPVRLLIDSGSELTFISSSVVKTRHLQRRPSVISVLGTGNEPAVQTRGVTTVTLRSAHTQEQVTINAHILKCVTSTLPTRQIKEINWSALNSLQLADPDYSTPRPIDILIRVDCYGLIVKAGIKQFPQSSLIAQDSIFGWMLIGSPQPTRCSSQRTHHAARVNSYQQVSDLLTKFWVQEEVPDTSASQLSPDDQSCEDHYVTTHSRDQDGRYIVRIPLKASPSFLGNSLARAHQCLLHMIRRLTKNDSYAQLYHNFMQEYESLNHMTRAKASPVNSPVYYLPHHGVLKEDIVTTKLLVVFNGSSPSSSGLSVNDIQHTQSSVYDSRAQQEERPRLTLVTQTIQHDYHWDMIYRHSRLIKLLRVTAICFRFSQLLRRVPQSSLTFPLTPQELERARIFWIKATQESYFSQEIKQINSNSLPVSHPLARLTAFIDTQGVIRVGGRLANASLDQEAKHPAILPQKIHLSRLIIADAHERTLHGGTQATLNLIRSSYWIIGGRLPVRSYIYHCMKCARLRGERAKQLMGQLPLSRITPARPFAVCGVDYAGPITLKTWKGRVAKTSKEIVTDYSADTFIAAFRRFTGRRGVCRTLLSDCGTTFQGADTLIRQLFKQGTQHASQLAAVFAKDGTEWRFNPPAAPHMGGKWEAAVKSVKFHLNRTIGDSLFTYGELSTLLVPIEAVLNSRPLEPLSADSTDISALTPAHFSVGEPLVTLPEPSLEDVPLLRLSRWQFIQQRLQSFWSTRSKQYLQQQLAISEWKHPSHQITVGSLVLLTDERFPPTKWPLARVIEVFPGADGLIRTVKLKTAAAELVRPLTKLVILPYTPPAEDQQRRC
ncbi:uncharacterized protein [Chelonus insularis]|uniref:uncharacterized protein n=1 Tax=Chelonus insularis TaxID=460826 RepID=UPI00158C3F57|nr:uncharacterized protein LOC118066522 [Chelonus insularis]